MTRSLGRGAVIWLLALGFLVAAVGMASRASAASGEFDGTISVDYHLVDDEKSSLNPGTSGAYTEKLHYDVHLTTMVKVYGYDTGAPQFLPVMGQPTRDVSGDITVSSSPALGYSCTGTFSAKPRNQSLPDITILPDQSGRRLFRVAVTALDLIAASGKGKCAAAATDGPQPQAWATALADAQGMQHAAIPLPSNDVVDTIAVQPTTATDGAGQSKTASMRAVLTITTNGSRPGATPQAVKAYASNEWREYRRIYEYVVAFNALQIQAFDQSQQFYRLSFNINPAFPGDSPSVRNYLLSQAFARATFVATLRQTESQLGNILLLLEEAYNDPPLSGYTHVPTIRRSAVRTGFPACPATPPQVKAFCQNAHAAGAGWLTALDRTRNLAKALATAVGRESAASKAGDAKSVALQQKAALALLPRLRTAEAKERAAGRRLAAVLRSVKLDPRLTADQARRSIAKFMGFLAAHRVSSSEVASILGTSPPAARPLDLLALLNS